MGRPFYVEFDDIDTGKFYVCPFCSTPFARNTEVYQYWKQWGEAVGEFICFSYLLKVSNVLDSGVIHEACDVHQQYDWQGIYCISCKNPVGCKFGEPNPRTLLEFYRLDSDKIVFRINGKDHDPETISPEDWFDPPRPLGSIICLP